MAIVPRPSAGADDAATPREPDAYGKRLVFRVLRPFLLDAYVDGDSCQGNSSLMRLMG